MFYRIKHFFTLLVHLKSKSRFWWKSRCMVFMLDVEFGDHLQGFDVTLQTQWFGCWLTWFMASLPPLPRDGGRADLNVASASMSYIRLLQRRIFMRIWAFGAKYSACSAYRLKLNISFFSHTIQSKISSNLNGGRLKWRIVDYRERESLKHISAFLIIFFCKNVN